MPTKEEQVKKKKDNKSGFLKRSFSSSSFLSGNASGEGRGQISVCGRANARPEREPLIALTERQDKQLHNKWDYETLKWWWAVQLLRSDRRFDKFIVFKSLRLWGLHQTTGQAKTKETAETVQTCKDTNNTKRAPGIYPKRSSDIKKR